MGRNIFRVLILFMVISFIGGAGNCLAKEKVYINGIDANFPPFAYVDKNGVPDGFDVKSIDWIAKEMGFKVTHQPMDWDGIIPSLRAKKIDMVASGMSITDKRSEQVNFTTPYWKIA
ncbi:MAG: amino acid ABC transporter substrate-binding protein, partial [Deltaproteobacteria bacterium]|nr:amino acid ABC transporter substrate-binding protein [Deltaproteobacteria bacterium]